MNEDTKKLLKRQISELTSRVDELESIVIDPFDCDGFRKKEIYLEQDKTFDEVVVALKNHRVAAREGWLKDNMPSYLRIGNLKHDGLVIRANNYEAYELYNITKDDLFANDWIVFKSVDVFTGYIKKKETIKIKTLEG